MNRLAPKLGTLPSVQRGVWPRLAGCRKYGFVLYGGTAIALRFGHRQSEDFDFFTEHPLEKSRLIRELPILTDAQVLQDIPDTLSVLVPVDNGSIKISFFGGIDFGRVGEPDITDDETAVIAAVEDLFATKLAAILNRVEARDYHDAVAMLRSGLPLSRGLGAARALFGAQFQPAEALKVLTFFEGGDLETLSSDERTFLIDQVKAVEAIPDIPVISKSLS